MIGREDHEPIAQVVLDGTTDPATFKLLCEWQEEQAYLDSCDAAERRMGA